MDTAQLVKGIEICEGKARFEMAEDFMSARVIRLAEDFRFPSVSELSAILETQGIHLKLLSVPEKTDKGWIVAKGIAPVQGEDGRIEIIARGTGKRDLSSSGLEDDNNVLVDPKQRNLIINVRRGEKIARRIPPGKGQTGRDLLGREIPALPGKWVSFRPGTGVEIIGDGQYLIATVNGRLSQNDEVISVLEEWELEGPVDMSTGHVSFCGKLLKVKGSVNSGFRVIVKGDLVVEGNIEDETLIDVGGNLTVNGLIRSKKTVVRAGANIQCGAIEYAEISAGRNLFVDDYVLDATIKAGGDVEVTEGKGLVAGGRILIGGSFVGKVVGTPAYVPIMIHAGFNPHIKDTHDNLVADLEDYARKRHELAKALKKMKILAEKRGGLSEKLVKLKGEIEEGIAKIDNATAERKQEIEALEAQIGMQLSSTVKVLDVAYPSVTIRIANAALTLKKMVESVKFRFRKGQIVLTTL